MAERLASARRVRVWQSPRAARSIRVARWWARFTCIGFPAPGSSLEHGQKPNYRCGVGFANFGGLVALSGSGKTLLIGNDLERSTSVGIGSDWRNNDATNAGAVWMW